MIDLKLYVNRKSLMIRGARHADVPLFTEDVELHRLKNRSDPGEEG